MESSTASFKGDDKPAAALTTRGIGHPPEGYPPPPHHGGFPPEAYPPPPPMAGYGGHPSPPPPYGAFPQPYPPLYAYVAPPPNPQGYGGYPYYGQPPPGVPAGYGYAPAPAPAHVQKIKKEKKKSGMSKMLGLGAGLLGGVVGGLLLGDLAPDIGAVDPSSLESFSDVSGGLTELYDANIQSMSESMDMLGSIG